MASIHISPCSCTSRSLVALDDSLSSLLVSDPASSSPCLDCWFFFFAGLLLDVCFKGFPQLLLSVKTRSNSFHSTLEPNTEVFSKVSRSLAQFTLVNSVSTLLNKGGITCNCPRASQDFCVNQNKQASAQLLCSSLGLSRHERSEGRRDSCEAEKYTHSEQHAPLQGCREDISGVVCSSWPTQNMPNMPKPCHKHAKVHADVCSGKNTYQSQKTDRGQTKRKHIFIPVVRRLHGQRPTRKT